MKFDVYFPIQRGDNYIPGTIAHPMTWAELDQLLRSDDISSTVLSIRAGNKELKKKLPAICWVGHATKGHRVASECEPTQFVMIDIDHVKDVEAAIQMIRCDIAKDDALFSHVLCIHRTPSLGIRIVFRAFEKEITGKECNTLALQMLWFCVRLNLTLYGDFDTAVKDYSRLSFLVPRSDFVYVNEKMMNDEITFTSSPLSNTFTEESESPAPSLLSEDPTEVFSEDEIAKFEELDYRGTPVKVIVEKYIEVVGKPSSGEVHNFYNELVKNFRCITSNDKRALLYLLPRFGHTMDECWSQIKSICKANTLSRLEKSFYFFLKDNGFYQPREGSGSELKEYLLSDKEELTVAPPYLPPVFKELVGGAPKDFVLPAVNALLPILGTLTSYLEAIYPYDGREHTTSFFSVIYAPPGTGKGFVERYMDLLFEDIKLRDYVQSERENVYLRAINKKGSNEKSPDMPHTSLRIIPPKNSEAEFLQKQRDNHGYHMFTYAAEMDSWAKGVRAAGGNKDDMIRIAWDNGEYGQQFKTASTFKGMTRLYWNVLITGTLAQLLNYFKNVENGLVTRCSFTSIDNQNYALAPKWRKLSKKDLSVIHRFMSRCDANTYVDPCGVTYGDLESVNDEDFDSAINWKFQFKPRVLVDMSWIMPVIDGFEKEQMSIAAKDVDEARDVFRRRVGVRGFRLALLCTALWERPRVSDLEKCKPFVDWWMHRDIENMLRLWGQKYNEQCVENPIMVQRSVYDVLDKTFSKSDVYCACTKQGIKTPIRRIIFDWKKLGYIESVDKDTFKKKI